MGDCINRALGQISKVFGKKITVVFFLVLLTAIIAAGFIIAYQYVQTEHAEQVHYEQDETELVVANTIGAQITLFRAGKNLNDMQSVPEFNGERIWLAKGNYFLRADQAGGSFFYPVPIQGYRSGTEKDDSFAVTIRSLPDEPPPLIPKAKFIFVPSGFFLFGDRLNPHERHYVWTQGFFIGQFEVSNAEFKQFLDDSDGYSDDSNWTPAGIDWKTRIHGKSSAQLSVADLEFKRFGQDDHPVTQVTWFEAAAFCRWLTRKLGGGRWLYSLPTEAEWEKAARGPDNFDYPLSQNLSDAEINFYNWRKNPLTESAVIGSSETPEKFQPNRYGIYHLGGNVVEWTQGLYWPFSRERPYVADDGRNREDSSGVRVVRGGSWYSASNALLYIPYRDTFQPEVSHNDLGFRIVVRSLMQ